jgi:AcrR family transcriptional regulator
MPIQERRARQKEDLRQEILDAARELFVREGYESVSMRKIADKVEYAPGTIYLYFEDKAAILDTLCQQTFTKLRERLEAIHQDQGDPVEALRRGLRTYIQFGLDNPNEYIITFILAKREPDVMERAGRQCGLACFACLSGMVKKCLDAGLINGGGVADTAQALWVSIHGLTSLFAMGCGFPFIERSRLIERQLDILIEGVRCHKK